MKRTIYFVLATLFFTCHSFAQSDSTIIKIHPIIGDTLDSFENDRYKIIDDRFDPLEYAIFYIKDGKTKAQYKYYDNSSKIVDYSLEKLMEGGARIDLIVNREAKSYLKVENKKGKKNKSAKLRIVYNSKKIRIRKHSDIRIVLHEKDETLLSSKNIDSGLIIAKLIAINDYKDPCITIKLQRKGNHRVTIPLCNIKMVRFYTPTENISNKILIVGGLTTCFFSTLASINEPKNIPLAAISGFIGFKPLIKGNKKYEIGENARFEIYY
jgi:hypothetical protein